MLHVDVSLPSEETLSLSIKPHEYLRCEPQNKPGYCLEMPGPRICYDGEHGLILVDADMRQTLAVSNTYVRLISFDKHDNFLWSLKLPMPGKEVAQCLRILLGAAYSGCSDEVASNVQEESQSRETAPSKRCRAGRICHMQGQQAGRGFGESRAERR